MARKAIVRWILPLVCLAAGLALADWWNAKRRGGSWPADSVRALWEETGASARTGENRPSGTRSAAPPPAPELATRSWGAGFRRRDGWTGAAQTRYDQQWALVIGVDAYVHLDDLQFAYNDARAIRDALTEFGYDEAHTLFLSAVHPDREKADPNGKAPDLQPGKKAQPAEEGTNRGLADAASVRQALFAPDGWLGKLTDGNPENGEIGRNDAILLVYAGHGDQRTDGAGYLLPSDGDPADPDTLVFLSEPVDRPGEANVKARLAALPCKHKAIILDACYAGAVFEEPAKAARAAARSTGGSGAEGLRQIGQGAGTSFRDEDAIAFYFREKAFLGLVAGRATPVADGGGEDRHSVFTHNLLDVLRRRADTARKEDHAFTFRELAMLVESQVGGERSNVGQVPRFGYLDAGGEGDLIFRETEPREIERERKLADEGRKWLEIAESHSTLPARQIFAAKALGFFGYGGLPDDQEERLFRMGNPACFDPRFHQADIDRARNLIEENRLEFRPKLYWSSPKGSERVNSVAWSPDGTRLASGSDDGTLRLWDAASGEQPGEALAGHGGAVMSVAWSPDGTRLVSGSWDGTVRLWDAASGEPIGEALAGHGNSVTSVAWGPDGTRLASGSWDRTVRLWDAASGEPIGEPLAGHEDAVMSVAWNPDGTRLASGSHDKTVRLWDAASGEQLGEPLAEPLDGLGDEVLSVAWSPDGTRLVSGSWDGTVRLWDAARGEQLGEPLAGHEDGVTSVAWSPDGTRLASGSKDGKLRLWDAASGEPIGEPLAGHEDGVTSVAWSPDGTRLASGSYAKTVRLWESQPRVFHGEYRLDLARYLRDRWVQVDAEGRGLDWSSSEGQVFGFRLDVISRGSITHLLRDTQDQPDRHRKLLRHHLDWRCWKPGWIWWERLLDEEWATLTPGQQHESVSGVFQAFYAPARESRTDAPSGWYESRLQGLWENHRAMVQSDLKAFPEWTLMSFAQGIASRPTPEERYGLEDLALESLKIMRQKRPDWVKSKPEWEQWEAALKQRPVVPTGTRTVR